MYLDKSTRYQPATAARFTQNGWVPTVSEPVSKGRDGGYGLILFVMFVCLVAVLAAAWLAGGM